MSENTISYSTLKVEHIPEIIATIAELWYSDFEASESLKIAEAELNYHLSFSEHSIVALKENKVVGLCLSAKTHAVHKPEARDAFNKLSGPLHKEYFKFLHAENKLVEAVIANQDTDIIGTIELLFMNPKAQGLGIGGKLFKDTLEWMKSQGVTEYLLATDDSCDWKFYEYKGLIREAEQNITTEHDESFNLYVYKGLLA